MKEKNFYARENNRLLAIYCDHEVVKVYVFSCDILLLSRYHYSKSKISLDSMFRDLIFKNGVIESKPSFFYKIRIAS